MQKIYAAVALAVTVTACSSGGSSKPAAAGPTGKPADTCGAITHYGTDGTVSPLFCADGKPSKAAVTYYSGGKYDALVLSQPSTATEPAVRTAMCSDISGGGALGLQTEGQAFQLAQALKGWTFTINAVDLSC